MIRFVTEYFRKTESYSAGRFIAEMFLLTILSKIFVITLTLTFIVIYEPLETFLVGEMDENVQQFTGLTWIMGLLIVCIIFPFLESFIGQGIPIWVLSYFFNNRAFNLIASTLWFVYLHSFILNGISFALIIFFGGIVFSWCFMVFFKRGFWKAIIVTTIVHSLSNITAFIAFYLF